jgi:glycosyltransferase involved in cell wall biosynthesis
MRVFNTETVRQSPTWTRSTIPIPILPEGNGVGKLARALRNGLCVARRASADDVVVFTDENPMSGNLFGMMQCLRRSRPTLVRTDPLLHMPRTFPRRKYLQAALAGVDCLIVWAPGVIERYHQSLNIPREKMVPLRFHHTLMDFQHSGRNYGDYIFSGGDSMRDYPTLIEAVRGLTIPVRIATHWQPPDTLTIPANVTIKPTGHGEFRELIEGARFVVFPLRMDDLRTSGQQSYLNAMVMGKAVIVTDTMDAPYYIDHERTGMLVPSGNVPALRAAVERLLGSVDLVRQMGESAHEVTARIDQEYTWSNVLAIAIDAHRRRLHKISKAAPGSDAR